MKALKKFFALFVMGAFVFAACEKQNPTTPGSNGGSATEEEEEEVTDEFPTIMPAVAEPAADQITIAIYVPQGTCNGAVLVGSFNGYNVGDQTYKFEKVENEDRWYQVTVAYADDFAAKAIALNEAGKSDWGTQWGMNIPDKQIENLVILGGDAVLVEENGGEQKLTAVPAGSKVFLGIKEWKSAPCAPRNQAGPATWTLTATGLPEGAVVGIVGALNADLNWAIGTPIVMTPGENNVWTAAAEVQEACEYKYFVSLDGGITWDWGIGEDGGNRQMSLDNNAVDTVEAWVGIPTEEAPAQ